MSDYIELLLLLGLYGIVAGSFLTLMDRIDEHNLIIGRYKTFLAYLTGFISLGGSILAMNILPELIVIHISLGIYWIVKNKLEYPSHVAFISGMSVYFGSQLSYIQKNSIYIIITTCILFCIGVFIKKLVPKESKFGKIFYGLYFSKIAQDCVISILLMQPLILMFTIPYAYACLFIKKFFPGIK